MGRCRCQDCTAATRAIVQRSLYEEFISGVGDLYARVKLGPTPDPATDLGPLISHGYRDKVAEMVDRARGYARAIGVGLPYDDLATGSYYRPTNDGWVTSVQWRWRASRLRR